MQVRETQTTHFCGFHKRLGAVGPRADLRRPSITIADVDGSYEGEQLFGRARYILLRTVPLPTVAYWAARSFVPLDVLCFHIDPDLDQLTGAPRRRRRRCVPRLNGADFVRPVTSRRLHLAPGGAKSVRAYEISAVAGGAGKMERRVSG